MPTNWCDPLCESNYFSSKVTVTKVGKRFSGEVWVDIDKKRLTNKNNQINVCFADEIWPEIMFLQYYSIPWYIDVSIVH